MFDPKDIDTLRKMQKSPIFFVEVMWGLVPQRDNLKFISGKNISWQQHDILLAIEKALLNKAQKRIAVRSGHGIGKSTTLAWLILWFLFCHQDAQIPCTAPTSDQLHDILWKEIYKWLQLMPEPVKELYEWSNTYIKIAESPNTWFARARTARRDSPEALAGIHGDHVMYIVDEASGVPDEIYNTAEGSLTGKNVLVILISNPTRLVGYFYDTFRADSKAWQKLNFSSKDSPIVEKDYISRIIEKHGEDSDEYRIRVLGEFPREDSVDEAGYVQMFFEPDIRETPVEQKFMGDVMLGVDPAGEGNDFTIWVLRDNFKCKVVGKEAVSNPKSIAQKTLTLADLYGVLDPNIVIDSFGEGSYTVQELQKAGHRITGVNVGDQPYDDMYWNLRAEAFDKLKKWIRGGGEFIKNDGWKELVLIRYRKEINGKLKVMSKREMRKKLGKSPDYADALMMTFVKPPKKVASQMLHKIKQKIRKRTYKLRMA